jgi:hypothetical protein
MTPLRRRLPGLQGAPVKDVGASGFGEDTLGNLVVDLTVVVAHAEVATPNTMACLGNFIIP